MYLTMKNNFIVSSIETTAIYVVEKQTGLKRIYKHFTLYLQILKCFINY